MGNKPQGSGLEDSAGETRSGDVDVEIDVLCKPVDIHSRFDKRIRRLSPWLC